MKLKNIKVGSLALKTRRELERFCRGVLNRYELRERVGPDDEQFLRDLIESHPDKLAKLEGHSISHFEIHSNTGGTRSFYLVRDDGVMLDFSYRKCIDPLMSR